MYVGNNPIAIKSMKLIVESLLELIKEKDFFKITIKDICENANVSRQTFYQFFSTKEDVIRLYLKKSFEKIYLEIKSKKDINPKTITKYFIYYFIENEEFIELLIKYRLAYLIIDELGFNIRKLGEIFNNKEYDNKKNYSIAFITGGISSTIFYWLKTDEKISEDELANLILEMVH